MKYVAAMRAKAIWHVEATREFCQATKSHWWMIWRLKAMKDVVSCDKLRGVANEL